MIMCDKLRVLIVIPAYNEAMTIGEVLHSLKDINSSWDLLVINDCSKDQTSEIAGSIEGTYVIDLPCNLGIGGAVQTGLIYACRKGYDFVVKFDGDGQHRAEEVNDILQPVIENRADMVIGSRFCAKSEGFKSTGSRRIGIKIFEFVNSFLIGQKITDNTSGFRAYNKKAVRMLAAEYPVDFPEPEEVIVLGKRGFVIEEVFVKMRERLGGNSSISGFKSLYYMVKVLLSVSMCALRNRRK